MRQGATVTAAMSVSSSSSYWASRIRGSNVPWGYTSWAWAKDIGYVTPKLETNYELTPDLVLRDDIVIASKFLELFYLDLRVQVEF
jgi:hypothetical protein